MTNLGDLIADPVTELGILQVQKSRSLGDMVMDYIQGLGTVEVPGAAPDDPILALAPVWAIDALTSLVGYSFLEEVHTALDLVGSNDAVQADSLIRPLYDPTAFNGRGGLYGVGKSIKQYLTAAVALNLGNEYTHVFVWKKREQCTNFDGFFCMRPDTTGAAAAGLVSLAYYGASGIGARMLSGPGIATANTYYDVTDSPTAEVVHIQQPITPGLGSKDWFLDRLVYERIPASDTSLASNHPRLGQGYPPSGASQLNGWIGSWYIFDRILSEPEVEIILEDLEARRPSYFRDALPVAWSHFEFRERRADGALPAENTAVDSAGGIPAGGALTNGVQQRNILGSESNPVGFGFDGVNDYVNFAAGSLDWILATAIFTVDIFLRLDSSGPASPSPFNNFDAGNLSFLLDYPGDHTAIRWWTQSGTNANISGVMEPDGVAPQHVVVTGDGVTARVYVDGSEVASSPQAPNAALPTTITPRVGGIGGRYFKGQINEPNFHKVALTPAEIQARTRLYRGDLGQRLIDAFGTGPTGWRHLFMQEEVRGETTYVDRITGESGTHNNGVETGVYSPVRGTCRRAFYDGVNDWSSFPDADWNLAMGAADSFSGFAIFDAGADVTSGVGLILAKFSTSGGNHGLYLTKNTTNKFQFYVRDPGVSLIRTSVNSYIDQQVTFGFSVDRNADEFTAWYESGGVVEQIGPATLGALGTIENPANYDLGSTPTIAQYKSIEMGPNGFRQGPMTPVEFQWIVDIAKWS